MRLEQLIQPKAGDRLSFEFGEELEIETPILYAEDDNIVVGADDKTFDLFNKLTDAEYRGRKVKLNKPTRGDVKKFKVYVKDPKTGNIKTVNLGHGGTSAKRKTMRIRKSNPARRKSFRARHNCDNPGPKYKARYWSCKFWSAKSVTDLMKG